MDKKKKKKLENVDLNSIKTYINSTFSLCNYLQIRFSLTLIIYLNFILTEICWFSPCIIIFNYYYSYTLRVNF